MTKPPAPIKPQIHIRASFNKAANNPWAVTPPAAASLSAPALSLAQGSTSPRMVPSQGGHSPVAVAPADSKPAVVGLRDIMEQESVSMKGSGHTPLKTPRLVHCLSTFLGAFWSWVARQLDTDNKNACL